MNLISVSEPKGTAAAARSQNWIQRHPLPVFFILAYAIGWGLSLLAVPALLPFRVPALLSAAGMILYHVAPSLAGIIMMGVLGGRIGVKSLLRQAGRLRAPVPWYLFALLFPFVLRLITIGLDRALGAPLPPFFSADGMDQMGLGTVTTGVLAFFGALILAGFGEEFGWRGFALPRMQGRYGALGASLIIAALWAPWHYNPLNFAAMQVKIPWHILSVIGFSVLTAWMYNSTNGNLWLIILLHGISDFSDWVIPIGVTATGSLTAFAIHSVLTLLAGILVAALYGAKTLRRQRPAGPSAASKIDLSLPE